jgi:group I intron endonuclease
MQIYLVTNLINGKKYLGKDVRNRKHYLGSGTVLRKAIKKYGRENFKKEIIEEHNDENKLKEREEYWLLFYDAANNINFYNRINKSNGAPKGRKITQKTRNKISKSLSGKPKSEEHIQKLKNREFTEDTKQKMSLIKKGKISNNPKKSILQYDKQGNFIKEWPSITEANKYISGDIGAAVRGKQKIAGGYIWREK